MHPTPGEIGGSRMFRGLVRWGGRRGHPYGDREVGRKCGRWNTQRIDQEGNKI